MWTYVYADELYHHGVKGMKWGVRRYQNPDGTLTAAGKKHKEAALKAIRKGRDEAAKNAKTYKEYTEINRKSLRVSKEYDKKSGQGTSWQTQALRDAYKATGREYMNAMYTLELWERDLKAYSNDDIKVGQDYVMKGFGKTSVVHTPSGSEKEQKIIDEVFNDFTKRYAKELKEYT